MIIERGIAARHAFQFVVKVEHNFGQGHIESQLHPLAGDIMFVLQYTALVETQLHHLPVELGFGNHLRLDVRFFNTVDQCRDRQSRRIVHIYFFALRGVHFVRHVGHRGDHVHVKLTVEALLYDLHVQQAEEAATEAEAQCQR